MVCSDLARAAFSKCAKKLANGHAELVFGKAPHNSELEMKGRTEEWNSTQLLRIAMVEMI